MKDFRLITYLCVLWLFGCSPISSTAATPILPTPTLTVTITPTKTAVAPTSTATPAPDFSATEHAITSTAMVEAVIGTQQPRTHGSYASPDGTWQAEVIIYDCIKVDPNPNADANAYEELRLVEESTGEIKVADSQLLNCGGLGAAGLEGLLWSPNSQFFYYTNAREGIPDGCTGFWQRPILRLDINTLQREDLGDGFLSPDGTKIAAWQETEMVIWDVNGGVEAGRLSPIALNTETGDGPIVWSPDSQALVYIQVESDCPVSGKSSVIHVDASSLEQKLLIESETPTFDSARWERENELILVAETGDQWVYTFDSQELAPLP